MKVCDIVYDKKYFGVSYYRKQSILSMANNPNEHGEPYSKSPCANITIWFEQIRSTGCEIKKMPE